MFRDIVKVYAATFLAALAINTVFWLVVDWFGG